MMAIRIDKAGRTGFLVSIKNTEENPILNGQIVELGDYVEPDVYGATAVKALDSDKLVIHASIDDKAICEEIFELKGEKVGRAYKPETGQVFTIPKTMFEGAVAVHEYVAPTVGSTKWTASATKPDAKVYGVVIAEEVFAKQDCYVIDIYSLI